VSLAGAGRAHHMQPQNPDRGAGSDAGFTMVEVLFTLALASTVLSVAIASTRDVVDELRTAMAARYLAARLTEARIGAVTRSACVGLRFVPEASDYRFAPFADGNGNGIRSLDIALGIDVPIGSPESLGEKFPGVSIGLMNGYPDADLIVGTGADGVRIGKSRIETMSPDGTATAGTVYLHGRRSQFAVRILGTTGRVRVLQYRPAGDEWFAR
jgi:prepilin-type N-terminal cleavage/methylation domain-containing protein